MPLGMLPYRTQVASASTDGNGVRVLSVQVFDATGSLRGTTTVPVTGEPTDYLLSRTAHEVALADAGGVIPLTATMASTYSCGQIMGANGRTNVRLSADTTKTDGTVIAPLPLGLPVTANGTYRFRYDLIHRSSLASLGFRVGLAVPAFNSFAARVSLPIAADGASCEHQGVINSSGDSVTGSAIPVINVDFLGVVEGVINPSSNGTIQLQFAAEATGGTVTLRSGSAGYVETV